MCRSKDANRFNCKTCQITEFGNLTMTKNVIIYESSKEIPQNVLIVADVEII